MDSKQIINQRQVAWLSSSLLTSWGVLSLQNVLIRVGEMDAWFSYLLPAAYVFLVAAFFGYLTKHFPNMHIFEISMLLLGRWGGTAVNLLILLHFWLAVVRDISYMSRFSATLLLHNTPLEILVLLACLILIYYGKSSMEVIVRVNDLFYPLFVITVVLMPIFLSNELSLKLVLPALTVPFQAIGSTNILALGGAGDIFVLGAFLHGLYNADHIRSAIRHGTVLGIVILTLVIFTILIVLGPKMPGKFLYPTHNLIQMIHVTDFLDRVDIAILSVWFPTIVCKTLAIYTALLLGISSLLKERNYPIFNKQAALLICLTTIVSFRSTTDMLSFANFSFPVIVLAYQPLVMAILFAASKLHRRQTECEHSQQAPGADSSMEPETKTAAWSQRFSYTGWIWTGNALILLCAVCIGVGLMFGKTSPRVAIFCAVGYAICLTLAAVTTYMEVSQLKQSKSNT